MKLKKTIITGFRSIKGTESLLVDDKVTILIGANDHGKSNILTALEYLNTEKVFTEDDKNWDIEDTSIVELTWYFSPSVDDLEKLSKLEIIFETIAEPVEESVPETTPIVETPVVQVETIPIEVEKTFEVNNDNEVVFYKKLNEGSLNIKSLPFKIPILKLNDVLKLLPRVELFTSPTTNIRDQVSLVELDKPEFEFMQGIFRLAGIWDKRTTIFTQNNTTSRILDEASEKLTKVLNDKWNQGRDLKWKLKHVGTNGDHISIEIQDPSIDNRYTRPSLRSSGFKTYFLLSMIILARTENKEENSYIYLFDEPGTYLHPNAQLDLQRSFETLSDKTQIIYTTHSLFLINKNYPDRNRVISKTKEGTKIDQKPFTKNWKSVRESLGILLSNNFLIAEKTLLVEGPSDVIYLLQSIKKLKQEKKIDIDLNDLSVVDAGTSENYVSMAKLMIAEGREIVALFDGDQTGKKLEKQLSKVCEKEIKDKKLQIHSLPENKSIEDVYVNIEKLRIAIQNVANNLVKLDVRKFKANLNIEQEIKKIKVERLNTLGYVLDKITPTWFEEEEKLSKLSIALEYEDIISPSDNIPTEAKTDIEEIKNKLNLREEKNDEDGVFIEV